jgi:predicted amidohydrolase
MALFRASRRPWRPVEFAGRRLGISICEDVWNDGDFWPRRLYREDPIEKLVAAGADLLINIAASPYTMAKRHLRPRMLANGGPALGPPPGLRQSGRRAGRPGLRRIEPGAGRAR